ncbi:hypothetical protein [Streptomyces sp. NPDC051016]|uniref:hypothetical protein n=1 Tax=Streptomyces sp. NPDC051016 TaxID=3365638 RepID=UPI0037928857
MSKHGPCRTCPAPAVAWLRFSRITSLRLCRTCLDSWFDMADDQPEMEPRIWGWLTSPVPSPETIAAWARDPRNHRDVAAVLRAEARRSPDWLRGFLEREARIQGGRLRLVPG